MVVGGNGWYQEKGKEAQLLKAGDVVEIAPDVVHWHGATADSWFSHLAIECNPQTNKNTWLDPVTDDEYNQLMKSAHLSLTMNAKQHLTEWWPGFESTYQQTNPDLVEIFGNFAFDDVLQQGTMDVKTRMMITAASSIAIGALSEYRLLIQAALNEGVTSVEIQEIVYQAIQIGRASCRERVLRLV